MWCIQGDNKSEFRGSPGIFRTIQDQVEEALKFVLRNIHLGAESSGIARHDVYEISIESIRELLLNAAIHRSYLDYSNIQVAIYDDRLEVLLPEKSRWARVPSA